MIIGNVTLVSLSISICIELVRIKSFSPTLISANLRNTNPALSMVLYSKEMNATTMTMVLAPI